MAENKKDVFLNTVYEQCTQVYTTFVNFRFQVFGLFALNAVLFDYINKPETKNSIFIIVGISAIYIAWILFFIDRRNRHIFRRAVRISSKIEEHFGIPMEMRLHTKSRSDLENKISHSRIFSAIVITITLFWLFVIFFHKYFINVTQAK